MAVGCVVVAGIVEAGQQALKGAPDVSNLLPAFLNSEKLNYLPLILLIIGGFMWVLGRRKTEPTPESQQTPSSTQAAGNSVMFLKAADFFKTFDNPVLIDIEAIIRTESDKYEPGLEHEKYLVRALASITTIGAFEITYT